MLPKFFSHRMWRKNLNPNLPIYALRIEKSKLRVLELKVMRDTHNLYRFLLKAILIVDPEDLCSPEKCIGDY